MPNNQLYLQELSAIQSKISTNGFMAANPDLRTFLDERGGLTNGFFMLPDPLFNGFKVFWDFNSESGFLASEQQPNSAESYLRRIGEDKRADLLVVFKRLLSELGGSYNHQYNTIEGLTELYNNGLYNIGTLEENPTIKLGMLETLDNKIQALNMMWKQITWDSERKVSIIPRNLRAFDCYIYVFSSTFYNTEVSFLPNHENTDLSNINHIMFHLSGVEFSRESGSSYFDNVARDTVEAAFTDITLTYEVGEISTLFRNITGDEAIDSSRLSFFSNVLYEFLVQGMEEQRFSDPNEDIAQNTLEITFEKSESQLNEDGSPKNSTT